MSTRVISFKHRINGVLANADAAVLNDPTSAFGLRRTDTNAILIAAGTVVPNVGTGLYQISVTDPADALTYEYWIQVTDGSNVKRVQRFSYPPSVTPALMYPASLAEADAIAATMPWLAAYSGATSDVKTFALSTASRHIDAMKYQGRKYDSAQALQFPRLAYAHTTAGMISLPIPEIPGSVSRLVNDDVWDWDLINRIAVVPQDVKTACVIEADSIIAGRRVDRLDAIHDGLAAQTTGGASENYRPGFDPGPVCREAEQLLRKYFLVSGNLR